MSDVAYLITYISYSYIVNKKGTIKENDLEQFILDELGEYIINNSASKKFETIDDIENFWNKYNKYLVWEAYCVKDSSWINVKPSNEKILDKILSIIRTNSFVDLEQINISKYSDISSDSIQLTQIENKSSILSSNYENISSLNIVDLEPNWEQIGNYEMNIQTNLENDY